MTFPTITATLAGFLIMLQQILMLNVGMHRANAGIGVGFAGDQHLERKARRHANLAENAALFLVVLALAELAGASAPIVLGFAAVFAVARISHAVSFSSLDGSHNAQGNPIFKALRAVGAFGTVLSGLALGGYTLYLVYG